MKRGSVPAQRLNGDPVIPADCAPFQRSTVVIATLTPTQRRAVRARALTGSYEGAAHMLDIKASTCAQQVQAAVQSVGSDDFIGLLRDLEWLRVPPDDCGNT